MGMKIPPKDPKSWRMQLPKKDIPKTAPTASWSKG